jgi:hypothetical protein
VNGAPHLNVHKQSQCEKIGDQGRSSITEERQGKPRHWKNSNSHSNIENNVEAHGGYDAQRHKKAEPVLRPERDI